MTAIILLILGIQLAVKYDDRARTIILFARFASYRRRLLPVAAARQDRRSAIRCLRCAASSRSSEETADLFR